MQMAQAISFRHSEPSHIQIPISSNIVCPIPQMSIQLHAYDKTQERLLPLQLDSTCVTRSLSDQSMISPDLRMCEESFHANFPQMEPLVITASDLQDPTKLGVMCVTVHMKGQNPSQSFAGQACGKMDPFARVHIPVHNMVTAVQDDKPLNYIVACSDGQDDVDVARMMMTCSFQATGLEKKLANNISSKQKMALSGMFRTASDLQTAVLEGQKQRINAISTAASSLTSTSSSGQDLQIIQVGTQLMAVRPEQLTQKQFTDTNFLVPQDVTGGPRDQHLVASKEAAEDHIKKTITKAKNRDDNMVGAPLQFDWEQASGVMDEFVKQKPGIFAPRLISLCTAAVAQRMSDVGDNNMTSQDYFHMVSSNSHPEELGHLYEALVTASSRLIGSTSTYMPDGNIDEVHGTTFKAKSGAICMKANATISGHGEHQQLSGVSSLIDLHFDKQQKEGLFGKTSHNNGYSNLPFETFQEFVQRGIAGDCEDHMAGIINGMSMLRLFEPDDLLPHIDTAFESAHPDVKKDKNNIKRTLRLLAEYTQHQDTLANTATPRRMVQGTLALAAAANQSMQGSGIAQLPTDNCNKKNAMTSFQEMMMGAKAGHACGVAASYQNILPLTQRVQKVAPGVSVHSIYDVTYLEGTALSQNYTEADPTVVCMLRSNNKKMNSALQNLNNQQMLKSKSLCIGNELRSKSLQRKKLQAYPVNFVNTVNDENCFYKSALNAGGFILASSDSQLGDDMIYPGRPVTNPNVHGIAFKYHLTDHEKLAIQAMVAASAHAYPNYASCNALPIDSFKHTGEKTHDTVYIRRQTPAYDPTTLTKNIKKYGAVGACPIDAHTTQYFF